jgi:hypothetical protein
LWGLYTHEDRTFSFGAGLVDGLADVRRRLDCLATRVEDYVTDLHAVLRGWTTWVHAHHNHALIPGTRDIPCR